MVNDGKGAVSPELINIVNNIMIPLKMKYVAKRLCEMSSGRVCSGDILWGYSR